MELPTNGMPMTRRMTSSTMTKPVEVYNDTPACRHAGVSEYT